VGCQLGYQSDCGRHFSTHNITVASVRHQSTQYCHVTSVRHQSVTSVSGANQKSFWHLTSIKAVTHIRFQRFRFVRHQLYRCRSHLTLIRSCQVSGTNQLTPVRRRRRVPKQPATYTQRKLKSKTARYEHPNPKYDICPYHGFSTIGRKIPVCTRLRRVMPSSSANAIEAPSDIWKASQTPSMHNLF
jgi:hypothetical protein